MFAAALQWSGRRHPPRPPALNGLARSINDAQPATGTAWQWSATYATSAHREMVVQVEALNVDHAQRIAESIVEPRRATFDDILVYVHRIGGGRELAARRIEWTPRGGYVEMRYSDR